MATPSRIDSKEFFPCYMNGYFFHFFCSVSNYSTIWQNFWRPNWVNSDFFGVGDKNGSLEATSMTTSSSKKIPEFLGQNLNQILVQLKIKLSSGSGCSTAVDHMSCSREVIASVLVVSWSITTFDPLCLLVLLIKRIKGIIVQSQRKLINLACIKKARFPLFQTQSAFMRLPN